jgi:hypothetical protein
VVRLILAEQFPVLVIVVSLISAFTIVVAGWVNRKSCWVIGSRIVQASFVFFAVGILWLTRLPLPFIRDALSELGVEVVP